MNDRDLRELLDTLPPAVARPGFSGRVMASLKTAPERRSPSWRWVTIAAVLVLLLTGVVWRMAAVERAESLQAEVEALRAESARLHAELNLLRRRAADPPVVYLGGTEDVDYVIDFARFEPSRSVRTAGL